MSEAVEAAFTSAADANASLYDVVMCYQIVLGRDPETSFVMEEAKRQKTKSILASLFASNEFAVHVAHSLGEGTRLRHDAHSRGPHADHVAWLRRQVQADSEIDAQLQAARDWTTFVPVLSRLIKAAVEGRGPKVEPPAAAEAVTLDAAQLAQPVTMARPDIGSETKTIPLALKVQLTDAELDLFQTVLRDADDYVEFGPGGITAIAAQLVKKSVTSVHSSAELLTAVERLCAEKACRLSPDLLHADIGPVGEWGVPLDPLTRARWPSYYELIWMQADKRNTDLYMVDGRFRVACVMSILLNGRPDAKIMIHDFASRQNYQIICSVAQEITRVGELSIFAPFQQNNRKRVTEILTEHRFDFG